MLPVPPIIGGGAPKLIFPISAGQTDFNVQAYLLANFGYDGSYARKLRLQGVGNPLFGASDISTYSLDTGVLHLGCELEIVGITIIGKGGAGATGGSDPGDPIHSHPAAAGQNGGVGYNLRIPLVTFRNCVIKAPGGGAGAGAPTWGCC